MFYIGSHETDNKNDSYLGSGVWLRKAIKKYGKDNFRREIIQECADRDEMYSLEEKLVESVRCTPNCYNINVGGSGGWNHINESGMHKGSNNPMNRPEIKQKVSSGLKKKREENKEKYLSYKQEVCDRSPKELGTIVKTSEVVYHHEVTNQVLWNKF